MGVGIENKSGARIPMLAADMIEKIMTDRLTQLEPVEFRLLWPTISAKVREIWEQQGSPGYLPEDVFAEVIHSNALFFHCDDGFVVLNTERNIYNGERHLNVWLAASYGLQYGVITKHKDEISDIARHFGCSRVTFRTARQGFMRISQIHGIELKELSFDWSVENGQ